MKSYTEADVERCERAMVEAVSPDMDSKDDVEFNKACVRAVLDAFTASDAARIAELEADAERLDWLVGECRNTDLFHLLPDWGGDYSLIRQAIDAARSRT